MRSNHSSGSLVISGPLATHKGVRTSNGGGSYNFTVVAYDCDVTSRCSSTNPDRVRIKITDNNNNAVVYDNVPTGDDPPSTPA
jgi:hypothetical protein